MSRNARIEEVSDSDSDPDIADISSITTPSSSSRNPSLIPANAIPSTSSSSIPTRPTHNFDSTTAKMWICLYPLYFDASKTKQQGRRVGKELAVQNPLARTIADGCAQLGLRCVFEAAKMHPKDWANVGRVKVEFRDEATGRPMRPHIKNSALHSIPAHFTS
jgi:signal recognition particle subunit SRP19